MKRTTLLVARSSASDPQPALSGWMWSDQFEITSCQARRLWSRKTMSASDSPEHHLRPALGYAITAIFKAHLRATFGVLRACPVGLHACHYGRWAGRQF